MLSSRPEPALYHVPGGVLALSGPDLQELLRVVLAKKATLRFKALGFSMHPFIRDGDVITVAPWEDRTPRLGDVVAFCHPQTGRLVVHRVITRQLDGLLLRGDNTTAADGLVAAETIIGLVTGVQRHGRPVRLGRGPERRLIAWLARYDLLQPMIYMATQVLSPLVKGFRHE